MAEDTLLTIKDRIFLKKLDKIVFLLEEIYGKMCGENPRHSIGFDSKPYKIDDDEDIPF
jgi:hypothetical protein